MHILRPQPRPTDSETTVLLKLLQASESFGITGPVSRVSDSECARVDPIICNLTNSHAIRRLLFQTIILQQRELLISNSIKLLHIISWEWEVEIELST